MLLRINLMFVLILLNCGNSYSAEAESLPKQLSQILAARPQPWERRSSPILSARTTKQDWCKVVLYSPYVIFHAGKYRMWYLGTSTATRTNDIVMGYAESVDGIDWQEHKQNPILTAADVPWGTIIQTPFVMFDDDEQTFKMWFVSGAGVVRDKKGKVLSNDQKLGYATSDDGINWKVRPKPIFWSGRSPSVIKVGPKKYRMWMNSKFNEEGSWNSLYRFIYEFSSTDGINWQRGEQPVVEPSGQAASAIYPCVIKLKNTYIMWYGCHIPGGQFELFYATSADGTAWQTDHKRAAFAAREGKTAFDSRYTSTPCVLREKNRLLMYYSARDWNREYIDSTGKKRKDGSSPYSHIGVATLRFGE